MPDHPPHACDSRHAPGGLTATRLGLLAALLMTTAAWACPAHSEDKAGAQQPTPTSQPISGQTRGQASGGVQRHGHSYVVYLPPGTNFREVLERLKSELGGQNWEVMGLYHIDVGMKQYGLNLENKLVLACKSQYLAQAIKDDPYITLIIPCRFTLFREPGQDGQPGRIVLGVADPVYEAQSMDIKEYKAAQIASDELKAVLENIARFYAGG